MKKKFEELYGKKCDNESFCPYRVCPVGAHSDHQYGFVTGFALDKGIHILYNINDSEDIAVTSKNFEGTEKFKISEIKEKLKVLPYVKQMIPSTTIFEYGFK